MATTVFRIPLQEGPYEMLFEHDAEIPTSDGSFLRASVFRPIDAGPCPVIFSLGVHPKDVHFRQYHPDIYHKLITRHPEVQRGTSCRFMHFETVDPERWIPLGYAVVRVDARGQGKSPGVTNPPFAPRFAQDLYDSIEWAGTQPWSNGKVGMLGISTFAVSQWYAAAAQPPHLAAIVPWEGAADFYRDVRRHGGIFCNSMQARAGAARAARPEGQPIVRPAASPRTHGFAGTPYFDMQTGEPVTGPEVLSDEELRANSRANAQEEGSPSPLDDGKKQPDFGKITVPLLSAGNWGAVGSHLRGNTEGYMRSASKQKWLEIHAGEHWEEFYLDRAIELQRRFFDHFLKGIDNGWDREPAVQLAIRRPDGVVYRTESEFPIARTRWTKMYLDVRAGFLLPENPPLEGVVRYAAMSDGVTFLTPPLEEELEITGLVALRLWVASSTEDMDVFATLRAFDPRGNEVTFQTFDPRGPISQGWLRVSQRKLDPVLSTPYRPYHTHDTIQKLTPGADYQIDVEIRATSVVLPPGYRLALTVQGKDFERPEGLIGSGMGAPMRGSAHFTHTDPKDRNPEVFGGKSSIISGGDKQSYLLLPVIPS